MPYFLRYAVVLDPIPHTSLIGNFPRNCALSESGITVRPLGFFHFDPIFASVLVTERPIEKVMPNSHCKVFCKQKAMCPACPVLKMASFCVADIFSPNVTIPPRSKIHVP